MTDLEVQKLKTLLESDSNYDVLCTLVKAVIPPEIVMGSPDKPMQSLYALVLQQGEVSAAKKFLAMLKKLKKETQETL